jgi:hypothetical protein
MMMRFKEMSSPWLPDGGDKISHSGFRRRLHDVASDGRRPQPMTFRLSLS